MEAPEENPVIVFSTYFRLLESLAVFTLVSFLLCPSPCAFMLKGHEHIWGPVSHGSIGRTRVERTLNYTRMGQG